MSEYIGVRGEVVGCDKSGKPLYSMYLTDEEIIRCRDCRKSDPAAYDYCEFYYAHECDKDGFCAWAERKHEKGVRFEDLFGILKKEEA